MRWHVLHAALLSKTSNPSCSSRDSRPQLTRAQKTINAALSRNQGPLVGGERPCHAVCGRRTIKGETKQMHVLRIRIQPVYGFVNANAHLSATEGTKRLLFERAEAAIPHQCG